MVSDDNAGNSTSAFSADTNATNHVRPNGPLRLPCRERFPTPRRRHIGVSTLEEIPHLRPIKPRSDHRSSPGRSSIHQEERRSSVASSGTANEPHHLSYTIT